MVSIYLCRSPAVSEGLAVSLCHRKTDGKKVIGGKSGKQFFEKDFVWMATHSDIRVLMFELTIGYLANKLQKKV